MPIARKYARIITRRPAKRTLTQLILEELGKAGESLLDSFFPAKYPEARLWRNLLGLDHAYVFKRATFAAILSQLKTQGLVERVERHGRWHWRVTSNGRSALRASTASEPPRSDGRKRLVCFDIPERDRAKRRWLRRELIACGYEALQKSVWIGETPLPQDFIAGLDALGLRDHVHLLRVETVGTLKGEKNRNPRYSS